MAGEQTASNVVVAIKRESTPGVAAGDTGGERIRIINSAGLVLDTAIAASAEKRADGNTQKGRHSAKSLNGAYNVELTAGGFLDIALEAILRSAWSAADTDAFAGVFTSIAIASNVFTATGGSFITAGYRVGQVLFCTGMEDAANDNVNCIVTAVTASTMTVEPAQGVALTDNAADTTGTFNRLGHVVNGAAPTEYHHTVEQRDVNLDLSEQFLGDKIVGFSLTIAPNAPVTATVTMAGINRVPLGTGDSPYFTTPNLTTGLAMVGDEITLRYNGVVETAFTSLTLNFAISNAGQAVLGSVFTPDIFANDLTLSGQATKIRSDHGQITLYDAETEFEIGVLLEDRSSAAPFDCYGFFMPVVTVDNVNAPVGGGDGPKIETLTLGFGTKASGVTGYDATQAVVSSSAQA